MKIKFSREANNIVRLSNEEARRLNNENISPEHLFLSLIKSNCKVTIDILIGLGADINRLTSTVEDSIKGEKKPLAKTGRFSIKAEKVLKISSLEAKLLKSKKIESFHILTSILRDDENEVTKQLNGIGINHESVSSEIEGRAEIKKDQSGKPVPSIREIFLFMRIFLIKHLTKDSIKADRKIVKLMAKEIFVKRGTSDYFQDKLYDFLDGCKAKKGHEEFIYLVDIVRNINLGVNQGQLEK